MLRASNAYVKKEKRQLKLTSVEESLFTNAIAKPTTKIMNNDQISK